MPITLTCPSCGKQCAVKDEYAGMQVRCPSCPAVITAPPAAQPAMVEAEPFASGPGPTFAPPPPRAPAGPGFVDKVTKFLAANGVHQVNMILLIIGVGCLGLFLITVLCPWFSVSGGGFSISRLGIQIGAGIVEFLLVLGVLFFLVFVVLMEWSPLFDYCLWTASNLAIFIVLHLLAMIGGGAGWGLFLSLIVMLGASGTLGVVAFSRVFGRRQPAQ